MRNRSLQPDTARDGWVEVDGVVVAADISIGVDLLLRDVLGQVGDALALRVGQLLAGGRLSTARWPHVAHDDDRSAGRDALTIGRVALLLKRHDRHAIGAARLADGADDVAHGQRVACDQWPLVAVFLFAVQHLRMFRVQPGLCEGDMETRDEGWFDGDATESRGVSGGLVAEDGVGIADRLGELANGLSSDNACLGRRLVADLWKRWGHAMLSSCI